MDSDLRQNTLQHLFDFLCVGVFMYILYNNNEDTCPPRVDFYTFFFIHRHPTLCFKSTKPRM